MEPLTQQSINDQRVNNPGHDWFFNALEEFLHELDHRQVEMDIEVVPHGIPNNNGQPCGICNLTFYYYFHLGHGLGVNFRNAIWIKADNIHNLDIWIRVGFNNLGRKKVDIYSRCLLNCHGIVMTNAPTLALPPHFNVPSIYKTNERVHPCTFNDILDEICNLMPCLCNGNCV